MKRLFVAIRLIPDSNTLNIINSLQKVLHYNKIRWVEPDRLHLTLKFIGNTPESSIPDIIEIIYKTVDGFKVVNYELNKIGIFGSRYNPKVIWLGITNNKQLEKLGNKLLNNFENAGFPRGRQNFVPHITIAKITKIIDKQVFNDEISKVNSLFFQQATMETIILFESILSDKAPAYNKIYSVSLLE